MMSRHEKLMGKVKNLSVKPGVYMMKDKTGKIIYIGKAKVLKNRVSQYFQDGAKADLKTQRMISNIADFDYIVTDTELEALVLERNLIRLHKPKYNILLKDDKNFPYIRITLNDAYPKITLARKVGDDGAKYFGPYFSSKTVNDTIWLLKRTFLISTCKLSFPDDIGRSRPCLNYHINRCIGPCTGSVTSEEYRELFSDIVSFIEGDYKDVIKTLEDKMSEASEKMEYERARVYRDRIASIKKLDEKQKVVLDAKTDCDVISYYVEGDILCFSVLIVRFGKLIDKKVIKQRLGAGFDESESLLQFVKQFYGPQAAIPRRILLSAQIEDRALIEEYLGTLSKGKVRISVPTRGWGLKLLNMSISNAKEEVRNDIRNMQKNEGILLELARILGLDVYPKRIEAYDVSHTGADAAVGAMVVFEDGAAKKSEYRKFKIKYSDSADDYGATKEIIYRRFEALEGGDEKFSNRPDLILLDGGIGHVNAVTEMFLELSISTPVFGMVKNKNHRIRGLVSTEGEMTFREVGDVYTLLGKISQEVHRFAVTYHRASRKKQVLKSALDDIAGLGPVKKKALMSQFGSVSKIASADIEDIAKVKGINAQLAERIKTKLLGGE